MCKLFCNIAKLFNLVVASCAKTEWIKLRVSYAIPGIYVFSATTFRHLQRPDFFGTIVRGIQRESLRKRPKNNGKAGLMLSEAILNIVEKILLFCSSLPARLMKEFPASKRYLHPATWLTGKLPSRRLSSHYWPVWVWAEGGIHPFSGRGRRGVGGGGGGERFFIYTKSAHFSPATLSFQGHIISPTSPSLQKLAWRTDILKNRSLGAPGQSWFIGSKAWNIAIQLVLQPCCKESCTFLFPA